MNKIRGYSSPFNLGHKALTNLFDGPVTVSEKIDGSQFSFGLVNGELLCRSRGRQIVMDAADMFDRAVEATRELAKQGLLTDGYTYRGEYLKKPKHNTLVYDRIPENNIILFDIDRGDQDYLPFNEAAARAADMGLEFVPSWEITSKPTMEQLEQWMQRKSILGNTTIEGIVFKNYARYGPDSKVLMGKYVSEKFREKHDADWKKRNPGDKAFVAMLTEQYATEARWMKAVQHLREIGELENEPRDIPKLLQEVNRDVLDECQEEIKEKLYSHFWKQMSRGLTRGLPEWWKELLAKEMLIDV